MWAVPAVPVVTVFLLSPRLINKSCDPLKDNFYPVPDKTVKHTCCMNYKKHLELWLVVCGKTKYPFSKARNPTARNPTPYSSTYIYN